MDYRTSKPIILVATIPYTFKRISDLALRFQRLNSGFGKLLKKWMFLVPTFCFISTIICYSQVLLFADSLEARAGQVVDIPVAVSDFEDIVSMQFSLNWDTTILKFKEVHSYTEALPQFNKENIGVAGVNSGKLIVVWLDNSLNGISVADSTYIMKVKFEVIGQEGEKSAVSFSDNPAVVEIVDANSLLVGADLVDGEVAIPSQMTTSAKFLQSPNGMRLFQNHPNPFNKKTTIQLFFDTSEWVTFTVTDVQGKSVYTEQFRSNSGRKDIQISKEKLPATGIYNYTIQAEAYQLSKQMILLP